MQLSTLSPNIGNIMRNKTRDPLKAIAIMRKAYKNKELSRQNKGCCSYYDKSCGKSCIVGSLVHFSEEEKKSSVDFLDGLSTIEVDLDDIYYTIDTHEGTVGGIKTSDLALLQEFHDDYQWSDLEEELDKLEEKYKV